MNKKNQIRSLTGIRGWAAMWVVGFHLYTTLAILFPKLALSLKICFEMGFLGVDLFFILSGFIIAYNYQEKLHPFHLGAYRNFLYARIARIYPVHLATLLACLGLYGGAKFMGMHLNTEATNWGLKSLCANVFMVHAWTDHHKISWNFPSWSISAEWLAYLCFPVFAAIFTLKWNRRALWAAIGLLMGAYIYLNLIKSDALHWAFISIAFEFPAGICLYNLSVLRKTSGRHFPMSEFIAVAIGAVMVVCSVFRFPGFLIIPLLALMLYSLAINQYGPLSQFLSTRVSCYWGRVSYSLYMTHAVASMVMIRLLPLPNFKEHSLMVRITVSLIYFAALALAAILSYHLVEKPARRYMLRLMPSEKEPALISLKQ